MIGLHCLTGCDSVSAFCGKGKKKALNLLKDDELCPAFRDLGERFDINPDMAMSMEKLVCKLYRQKGIETVNEARYNMFRLARKSEITTDIDRVVDGVVRQLKQVGLSPT